MSFQLNLTAEAQLPVPSSKIITDTESKYFEKLCASIICYPDCIHFNGRVKELYMDNPFTTIINESRWSAIKKNKFEQYITNVYGSPENFNNWVIKDRKKTFNDSMNVSFINDKSFNLVFITINGTHLECYIRQSTIHGQIKLYNSSYKNRDFYSEIINYLRDVKNLRNISNISDWKVRRALRYEVNNGHHKFNGKVKLISNSTKPLCYAYVPIDSLKNGDYPTWKEFISQFNTYREKKLFIAWVYSIFVEEDNNRQVLWVEGEGFTGKSTVFNVIGEILLEYNDCLFRSIPAENHFDKHSLEGFDKCRLAVFPNADEEYFFKRLEILNMSGGDYITINPKNKAPITQKVFVKIAVHSNYPPIIDKSQKHEVTRLLHVWISPERVKNNVWAGESHTFPKRLKQEFYYFLEGCKKHYDDCIQKSGLLVWDEKIS